MDNNTSNAAVPQYAWHFCAVRDGKSVLRDGRELAIGEWLVHEGPVEICSTGLHASVNALDALRYAPGLFVTRVRVEQVEDQHDDKLVCRRRFPEYGYDARQVVLAWARRVALDVLDKWNAPAVVAEFLRTGKGAVAARRAAANAAAYAAASAAYAADAASAAYAADAASATYAAAGCKSARAKYNTWLTEMLESRSVTFEGADTSGR